MASLPIDDRDLDDAALWAVIDSAAAAAAAYYSSPTTTTTTSRKPSSTLEYFPNFKSPPKPRLLHPSQVKAPAIRVPSDEDFRRPPKLSRTSSASCVVSETSESSPDLMVVKHFPANHQIYSSPKFQISPQIEFRACDEEKESFPHCLAGRFPTVSLFKDYQDAAMSILEKSDYTIISGNPFIKKSGWRKIAFYFNVSFEIRDKNIDYDEHRNVQRAEFVARAYMQGGRFSDGWGSCERREKKFLKPNNDIPSTAETRAKNKACQDLIGIGQYRPGVSHNHSPR